jgi:hypothetical protein
MPRAVGPFARPFAFAMPALIERQYVKIVDERRCNKIPPMRMRRSAVDEQERALAVAAVVKAIQRETVGDEAMRFHFFNFFTFLLTASSLSPNPSPFWRGEPEDWGHDTFASWPFHATI